MKKKCRLKDIVKANEGLEDDEKIFKKEHISFFKKFVRNDLEKVIDSIYLEMNNELDINFKGIICQ